MWTGMLCRFVPYRDAHIKNFIKGASVSVSDGDAAEIDMNDESLFMKNQNENYKAALLLENQPGKALMEANGSLMVGDAN